MALYIPSDIFKELWKVALKFPNDILTDKSLLHTFFMWYNLTQALELSQKESVRQVKKDTKKTSAAWTASMVDLVECILAWPHYLRWTEETGDSEYHHFFRYVDRIFRADRARPALATNEVTLDVAGT
ncbi:hypothetical protein GGI35DRAFT_457200 [Trichoderma velutinum]